MRSSNILNSVVIVVFLLNFLIDLIDCNSSGFYIDDGDGQTIIDESIPSVDTQQMQHEILQLLGLPHRPQTERFPSLIRLVIFFFL